MATWLTYVRAYVPGVDPRPLLPRPGQLRGVVRALLRLHGVEDPDGVIPWDEPTPAPRGLPPCPLSEALLIAAERHGSPLWRSNLRVATLATFPGPDRADVARAINEVLRDVSAKSERV